MTDVISTTPGQPGELDYAAFVALDWADQEHAWVLEEAGSGRRERGTLQHTAEAIDEWAIGLAGRFPGRAIAVCLEQSRGALVCALSKYGQFTLFPVHPSTSCRYRAALFPSGAKDDPKDAELLLDLLVRHRERLRPLRPDTAQTRELQMLVEKRRQLVDERTAQTNRITAHLKLYFPQVLAWFDEVGSPLVHAFLRRWPTLPQLQAEKPETILEFLHAQNCRSQARNQERLEQIVQARPMTTDAAILAPAVLLVQTLLEVVAALRTGIAAIEKAIEQLCAQHADYAIFASFPNAGRVLAPRLLAAFGSQRDRFSSVHELQAFSGIAPVISRSGPSQWIHFRWACPKFLRQTFHEYAGVSIQRAPWARAFYDKQRAKSKSHHAALRSLAFKWIRILYRCWKDRTLYSETHHVSHQATRKLTPPATNSSPPSPKRSVDTPVEMMFKRVGGFWKLTDATS